jgi:hypothetical protein
MRHRRQLPWLAIALCILASPALAKDPANEAPTSGAAAAATDSADDAPIFGRDLMTPQERMTQRARMRAARTDEEREAIRAEHHRQMVERAKERGVTLPETPPARGVGAGRGPGGGPPPGR